jgi:hypothetical protein
MLRGQPLEEHVGVRRMAHRERADLRVRSGPVPDEDAASAPHGDEGRQQVRQLTLVVARARAKQVEAVEEVERGVSHRHPREDAGAWLRRATAPRRR